MSHLAEMTEKALQEEYDSYEIIIGWTALLYVSVTLLIYALTPRVVSANVHFEPVLWTLSGFIPFLLLRLFLAYRRLLRPWMHYTTAVVDSLALTGLLIAFQLQYDQVATFLLRTPTYTMFFAIVALRSMRNNTRYLLVSGATSLFGILFLCAYCMLAPGTKVTHDLIEYTRTVETFMPAAEIEKFLSLLVVTIVLALGSRRSSHFLRKALMEAESRRELGYFFSPEIMKKILSAEVAPQPGRGESRTAAIIFTDLRGFTKLSQKSPPEVVLRSLGQYQDRVVSAILEHGGVVDKFMGDGVLAHFGAAVSSPTYARDALKAIEKILVAMSEWNEERTARGEPELGVGAACAIGTVLFGAVGSNQRLEFTVIGDAVNLAAKLEKHTKTAGTPAVVTQRVLAIAKDQGYVETLPTVPFAKSKVEGVEFPLDLVGYHLTPQARKKAA